MILFYLQGVYGRENYGRIKSFSKRYLNVTEKTVLVIGSITPWLELMMLKHGAKSVTSLDYFDYQSEHPKIHTLSQQKLSQINVMFTTRAFPWIAGQTQSIYSFQFLNKRLIEITNIVACKI